MEAQPFLADPTEQWVEHLELHIRDHYLRLRMAHKAAQVA